MFAALTADRDNQYLMIDSTIVRAHQQAASERGGQGSGAGALPRWTDHQIHMLADALGRPLRLVVTAGQAGDVTQAPALLEGRVAKAVLADKAYDSNALRAIIAAMGAIAVIPSNRTRKVIIPHDVIAYRHSNRIASTASSTSGASPSAMSAEPSTSQALSISPPP